MRTIKLTIEYDGTHFSGWQVQDNNERTVQGEIEKALKKIFKRSTRLIGSGRTDTGVHAIGQIAHFKANTAMPKENILRALNANLPEDIVILEAENVAADFHAQYSVKSKLYRYTILNRPIRSAHERHFCFHDQRPLDLSRMRTEAKALIGRKNFKSFAATDLSRKNQNTVRTVKKLTIKKVRDFVIIDIEADGFLYKMVRNIVGSLLEVGHGKLPKGSIKKILEQKSRKANFKTAKAQGLCLISVKY